MKVLCITNILSSLSFSVVEGDDIFLDVFVSTRDQIKNLSYIFDFINSQINLEDIGRVFVTNGPGYFTTLRIGCVIAQTISFILSKELTYIDNFRACENVNRIFSDDSPTIPVIKIASKRYRFKLYQSDYETSNLEEIIQISKNKNYRIISSDLDTDEIELIKNGKVKYTDLSKIFRAGIVYLSSIDNLEFAKEYLIKIKY